MPTDSTQDDPNDTPDEGESDPLVESETATDVESGTEAGTASDTGSETDPGDVVGDAQEAIEAARRRLADVPAEVVITNHVMGLYELAAIHLSSATPDLRSAVLAIDAVACLVDGLGDRLGRDAATMRDALANIRMAFVQIKAAQSQPAADASPPEPDE